MVSALRYFKTIVDKMAIDKKVLEMLPGSASKVLEAILPLVQIDTRIQQRWVGGWEGSRPALQVRAAFRSACTRSSVVQPPARFSAQSCCPSLAFASCPCCSGPRGVKLGSHSMT